MDGGQPEVGPQVQGLLPGTRVAFTTQVRGARLQDRGRKTALPEIGPSDPTSLESSPGSPGFVTLRPRYRLMYAHRTS